MNHPVQNLKGKAVPPAHHAGIEGTEVQLPSFLTAALKGNKWPASYPNFFIAGVKNT